MTNRAPSTIWSVGPDPQQMKAYVRTGDDDTIQIAAPVFGTLLGWSHIVVDRHTARMIAKRINQCLDETRKK